VTAVKKIRVMESVRSRNDAAARGFNEYLTANRVCCVNMLGAPGAGKTSLLIQLIKLLDKPSFVIEGDVASDIDTRMLNGLGITAVQMNTGGACHLNAAAVADIYKRHASGFADGYLFIENIGNLICPADFSLGEHASMLVVSVTDGSDKPYKYPLAFEKTDAVLLNKIDLADRVDFDRVFFMTGISLLNGGASVFDVSGKTGAGAEVVAQWLSDRRSRLFHI